MAQAVATETKKPVRSETSKAEASKAPRSETPKVRATGRATTSQPSTRRTRGTAALPATDTTARPAEGGLRNEVVGIGIMAASLCLMLALASFHPDDVAANGQAALTGQAHNLIGPVGAFVADVLLYIFGAAAFLLPVTLALPGLAFVTGRAIKLRLADAAGYPVLIFFGAMAAHLWMEGQAVLGHAAGGFIGAHGAEILQALFGRTGAYIMVYAVISLTFIVTTRISLVKLAGKATAPIARRARTASDEARKSANQIAGSVRGRVTDRFKNWRLRRSELQARQKTLKAELSRRKAEAAQLKGEAKSARQAEARAARDARDAAKAAARLAPRPERTAERSAPAAEAPEASRPSGGWRLRRPRLKSPGPTPGDTGGFVMGDLPSARPTGGFQLISDGTPSKGRDKGRGAEKPPAERPAAERPAAERPAAAERTPDRAPVGRTSGEAPRIAAPAARKGADPARPAADARKATPRARPAVDESPTTLQPILEADDLGAVLDDPLDRQAADGRNDTACVEAVPLPVVHRRLTHAQLQLDMPLNQPRPLADWEFPPLRFLDFERTDEIEVDPVRLQQQSDRLVEALRTFKIDGRVTEIHPGPVVTMFEFEPAPGVRISRIASLADDLAMALKAIKVRIVAPIPGKGVVGFEVPNLNREMVYLQEIIASPAFRDKKNALPIALGKDIHGNAVFTDLAKMPHLLVAGTTGSGKSVGVNGMITSLLYHASPDDVRFIMVDPKMLELSVYEGIPHLLLPVVTDPKKAAAALNWACQEMDRRYEVMKDAGVRNLRGFNKGVERWLAGERGEGVPDFQFELGDEPRRLPYIVVVIDEFADLMMVAGKEVEYCVARIAQKARAAGIHLILATQRPSIDVITGVIKANFPTRIAFRVSSGIDSRTILSTNGAENLLGNGDMLFMPPGTSRLDRVHGAYVDEGEIARIVDFVKDQRDPEYLDPSVLEAPADGEGAEDGEGADDPMYEECVRCVFRDGRASTSHLQRRLSLGYNRAARIVDQMERDGLVGPGQGAKPRSVNKQVMAELINRWDAA